MHRDAYKPPSPAEPGHEGSAPLNPEQISRIAAGATRMKRLHLTLPPQAVREQAAGRIYCAGWMFRWFWHPHGALEVWSGHRLTTPKWRMIETDGSCLHFKVPGEDPASDAPPEQVDKHRRCTERYARELDESDMGFSLHDLPAGMTSGGGLLWCLDGGPWQSSPMPRGR